MTRLLIITQAVDRNNPVLGFFHGWIEEFSEHYENISVVTLYEGDHKLPSNVSVYSLGKEKGNSRLKYVINFYKCIFSLRSDYDKVFVHMNQEYVLLGGLFWRIAGKRVYLWRNHAKGSLLTKIACLFSNKVFCTSPDSYVAKYRKSSIMPVGVDTGIFRPSSTSEKKDAFLVFGRVSPVKEIDIILQVAKLFKEQGKRIKIDIVGDPTTRDLQYFKSLKNYVGENNLGEIVSFYPGITNDEASFLYQKYNYYINLTPSGSMDKTILEALSCGLITVVANSAFIGKITNRLIVSDLGDLDNIVGTIDFALKHSPSKEEKERVNNFIMENNLKELSNKLSVAMKS